MSDLEKLARRYGVSANDLQMMTSNGLTASLAFIMDSHGYTMKNALALLDQHGPSAMLILNDVFGTLGKKA